MASRAELIQSVCIGFEIAEYSDHLRNEHHFSDPEAFERIRLGYSCASCLARFKMYMQVCPLCGNERDVERDLHETPADIQSYWDEANGPGEKTVTKPMNEVIEELARGSAEMDSIPIKKLRPSKWGKGG